MRSGAFVLAVACLLSIPAASRAGHPVHHNGGTHRGGSGMPAYDYSAHTVAPHVKDKHPFKPVANKPEVIAAQQEKFSKLRTALDAVAPKSTLSKDQKGTLQGDLLAVVDGSTKPHAAQVSRLTEDLASALANRSKPALDTAELAQHLKTVMNTAYMPPADVSKAIRSNEDVLKQAGVRPTDAQVVSKDLKDIVSSLKVDGKPGMIK